MIHAYTGCDTVSSFNTKGKKTAWEIWKMLEGLTPALLLATSDTSNNNDGVVAAMERFTILLYDQTSNLKSIDETHLGIFTKKGGAMDAIPPTKAALTQHIKRALHQGGHCCGHSLKEVMNMPSLGG